MEEIITIKELNQIKRNSELNKDEVMPIKDAINKNKANLERYSLGYKIFDKAMKGGIKNGDLIVISGISGEGKTSFSRTLTYNLCKQGIPCLWFSYEVTIEALNESFLAMGINEHYNAYTPKKNTTGKLNWIKEKIREGHIKYETKVIFIDHIDFLIPENIKSSDNETIAYKKIITQLKSLAIELNVIIVVMAHLKKLSEGKEPGMQDIAYSAGIFHLADYVLMIQREKIKSGNFSEDLATNNGIIKILKNRETGQLKQIKLQYHNERFVEIDYQHEETSKSINEFKFNQ